MKACIFQLYGPLVSWEEIAVGARVDIVYYIDMNEWNGRRDVQLKIIDVCQHET